MDVIVLYLVNVGHKIVLIINANQTVTLLNKVGSSKILATVSKMMNVYQESVIIQCALQHVALSKELVHIVMDVSALIILNVFLVCALDNSVSQIVLANLQDTSMIVVSVQLIRSVIQTSAITVTVNLLVQQVMP